MSLFRTVKDAGRMEHIAGVMLETELGYFINKINFLKHLPIHKKVKAVAAEPISNQAEAAIRLRKALEKLGPTFIKLGQLLALRSDLVPEVFCKEFHKLQDNVPPEPYSEVKRMVENEIGKPINQVFSKFDEKPIASASIAQVHKAKLKSGESVAVKVQRPHLKGIISTDIDILYDVAGLLKKRREFKNYDPVGIVTEFEAYTKNELDFELESRNVLRFYKHFKGSKKIFIPKPFIEHCTKRVLVLQWVEGVPFTKPELIKQKGFDTKKLVMNGVETSFEMVFNMRFFHADAHPGNLFAMKGNKVGLVDFGIVGRIAEELEEQVLSFLLAVMDYDVPRVRRAILEIAEVRDVVDLKKLDAHIDASIGEWYGSSLKDERITMMVYKMINSFVKFGLKIPVDVTMFIKAIVNIEGTGYDIYPEFNFVEDVKPILEKYYKDKFAPKKLMKKGALEIRDFEYLVEHIPEHSEKFLRFVEKGEFGVKVDGRDLEVIRKEIDHQGDSKSLAMIFAGLIVASAIFSFSPSAPMLFGTNMAVIGFLGAGVVAAIYIAILIRHHEYKTIR